MANAFPDDVVNHVDEVGQLADDRCNYWALLIWSSQPFQYNLLDVFEMPVFRMLYDPTVEALLPVTVFFQQSGRREREERLGRILQSGSK